MDIKNELLKIEEFTNKFRLKLLDENEQSASKQVYFLDVQTDLKANMDTLGTVIKTYQSIELSPDSEENQVFMKARALYKDLKAITATFRQECLSISTDVNESQVTAVLNEDTIKNAAQNNKTTQKVVQDLNQIEKERTAASVQEFNYALRIDNKFTYYNETTKEGLIADINAAAQANPNAKVFELYQVTLKPVPLKQQTILTID